MRTARPTVLPGGVLVVLLAGALLLACSSQRCGAENVVIRNESAVPLVINVVGVVGKHLQRGRPILLNPRDTSPAIFVPGNKVLTVYDGRVPNRVLFQGVVPASSRDQFLAVVPGQPPPRMRLEMRPPFRGR